MCGLYACKVGDTYICIDQIYSGNIQLVSGCCKIVKYLFKKNLKDCYFLLKFITIVSGETLR